jgi:RNA polymerase sigma factor (TIGR02999 family)
MKPDSGEVTRLLHSVKSGDRGAESQLFELLYGELRRLAAARMQSERNAHTLTPTALVHEAYMRLLGHPKDFQNRSHFLAVAAKAMRRVLVDHARAKQTAKRGAASDRIDLDGTDLKLPMKDENLLALDEALDLLSRMSPRQSTVVEMRYFAGLSEREIASTLGLTTRTIDRDWQMARAWLHQYLRK